MSAATSAPSQRSWTTLLGPEVAQILSTIASSKYPRMEIPNCAINHNLTVEQLRQLLDAHGYPDKVVMRRRIGELLDAAARPAPAPAAAGDTSGAGTPLEVPIGKVLPNPDNPREELSGIEDLAASIEAIGLLEPIVVRRRGDAFVMVAGHRRRAALGLLQRTTVPVVIADLRPADDLAAMLIENGQREDLDPIEEARALRVLADRRRTPCPHQQLDGCDVDGCPGPQPLTHLALGRLIGRSQPYVSGRLALLDLTETEQDAIRAGHLGIGEGARRGRGKAGRIRSGAKGKASAAHFDDFHPLASAARTICRNAGHSKHTAGGIIGHVACGYCWETVIRSDEAAKHERRRRSSSEAHFLDADT